MLQRSAQLTDVLSCSATAPARTPGRPALAGRLPGGRSHEVCPLLVTPAHVLHLQCASTCAQHQQHLMPSRPSLAASADRGTPGGARSELAQVPYALPLQAPEAAQADCVLALQNSCVHSHVAARAAALGVHLPKLGRWKSTAVMASHAQLLRRVAGQCCMLLCRYPMSENQCTCTQLQR